MYEIYKSSINGGYLACGTFSIDLDGGIAAERNMFTQSELTRILIQDKAIDCVPQLCDMCDIKAKDCSDCKLLNKPSSLRELTENELIKIGCYIAFWCIILSDLLWIAPGLCSLVFVVADASLRLVLTSDAKRIV